jgi:CRP-like cAMP-binding protein
MQRLVQGGPERQAIEAGEIDAIIDYTSSNVILFPAARRALRDAVNPAPAASREAAAEVPSANRLLAALPQAEYQRLRTSLEPVTLTFGEMLYEPGAPIRQVYFPISCLVSLLTRLKGRPALEVGLVGPEGMVSIASALGVSVSPTLALVQGTGIAMRMEAARFRDELLRSMPFQKAVYRYTHALMAQLAQTAACNRYHLTAERLARWLLMTHDRVQSSELQLTHDFLADMLGVRRVAVTNAASLLKKRKLINYGRGVITILDRKRLGAASCECYQIIKRIYASADADG